MFKAIHFSVFKPLKKLDRNALGWIQSQRNKANIWTYFTGGPVKPPGTLALITDTFMCPFCPKLLSRYCSFTYDLLHPALKCSHLWGGRHRFGSARSAGSVRAVADTASAYGVGQLSDSDTGIWKVWEILATPKKIYHTSHENVATRSEVCKNSQMEKYPGRNWLEEHGTDWMELSIVERLKKTRASGT